MTKGLDEILSGSEPAQVEQPSAPEPSPEPSQPRDEHGKFAPKANEPEPAPSPEPAPVESGQQPAPPGVLEERNRRKTAEERADRLERDLAELRGSVSTLAQQRQQQPAPAPQPPPKPIDFWEDPNKFVESAMTPIQQELAQTRFELSLDRAVAKHGEEAIEAAQAWLREQVDAGVLDRGKVEARLAQSRSPVMDIVHWHQQQPANVEARLRAEIEAKVRAELGGGNPAPAPSVEQPSNPAPVMPSNLVGQRNVGTRSGPAWSGPASINDIFDRARNKKAG